jgi:hypothetical protein
MGYRDELVRRLKHDGSWAAMTAQSQSRFANLSDEQARHMMVLEDQWNLGETGAVNLVGLMSIVRLIQSFKGALVETDGENIGSLAKAGKLLAEFVIELSDKGMSAEEVEKGLSHLSPFVIAALLASYKMTS